MYSVALGWWVGFSQFKNLQSSKKLDVTFSVNSFVDIFCSCDDLIILSSISVIFLTYVTFEKVFFSNLKRISKITSGRAFPIWGSSYTVGPQTYIPICFLSFGTNCSFLLVKLFVKKISILVD